LVGTAADTLAALTVGTNGHTLVADSVEATGLKWVAPAAPGFSGASVFPSANISLAGTSSTTIIYDSESYDTDAYHSTVTNTERFTIPSGKSGKFLLLGNFTIESQTASVIGILKLNGTTDLREWTLTTSPEKTLNCHTVLDLTAGDFVEIRIFNGSGTGTNLLSGAGKSSYWSISYLGA
jgi:hypothetical protein